MLRKISKILLLAAVGVSLSSTSFAQDDTVVREADTTSFKKKTVIDFSDVTIEGELTKPEGSYLLNRKKTNFNSLLKIRQNFLPELQYSMDNL